MNLRSLFTTLGWQVRETFRQAVATRIFWLMLAVTALCVVVCLGTRIERGQPLKPVGEVELFGGDQKPLTGPNPNPGRLSLGFGLMRVVLFRDGKAEVHFLQVLLAKWIAGAAGTLLVLVWTAGFLPEFLHPDSAAVLLAKPVPRWWLLVGKWLGVLAFVAFHATLFVGGTWLALGLRTGIWFPGYLVSIPLLVLNFAIVYGASAVLAVCTRNTATCIFGSLVFWLICFGMNSGRNFVATLPETGAATAPSPPALRWVVEASYWVLPKPADLTMLLDRSLQSSQHFQVQAGSAGGPAIGVLGPALSISTSLLFAAAMLAIAARQLTVTDY